MEPTPIKRPAPTPPDPNFEPAPKLPGLVHYIWGAVAVLATFLGGLLDGESDTQTPPDPDLVDTNPDPWPKPSPSEPPPAPDPVVPAPKPPIEKGPTAEAAELLRLHNRLRADLGAGPLTRSAELDKAARVHAEWMAAVGKLSHTGEGGSTPWQRMKRAGYQSFGTGENIAMGHRSPSAVFQGWVDSPGHYANIVNRDSNQMGAALAKGRRPYWVVVFGRSGPSAQSELIQLLPKPIETEE